jgi:hypothetical protein
VAQAPILPRGFELPLKQRLPRIGSIDQVAVEGRAADLAKRAIKKDAKVWALELALRCCDLRARTRRGRSPRSAPRRSGPTPATRTCRRWRRCASIRT